MPPGGRRRPRALAWAAVCAAAGAGAVPADPADSARKLVGLRQEAEALAVRRDAAMATLVKHYSVPAPPPPAAAPPLGPVSEPPPGPPVSPHSRPVLPAPPANLPPAPAPAHAGAPSEWPSASSLRHASAATLGCKRDVPRGHLLPREGTEECGFPIARPYLLIRHMAALFLGEDADGALQLQVCAADGPGSEEGWRDDFFEPAHIRALTVSDCDAFDIWGRAIGPEIIALDFKQKAGRCEWTATFPDDAAEGQYQVEAILGWYNGAVPQRKWESAAEQGTVWPPPLVELHETRSTFRGANMQVCDDRCQMFPRCRYWTAYGPGHDLPNPNRTAVSTPDNALGPGDGLFSNRCRMFISVGAERPVPQPERPPSADRWAWAKYASGKKNPIEKYYLGAKLTPGSRLDRSWRGGHGTPCRLQAHAAGSPLTVVRSGRPLSRRAALPSCSGAPALSAPGRWVRTDRPSDCAEGDVFPDGPGRPDAPGPPHSSCAAHTKMPLPGYVWQPLHCNVRSFDHEGAAQCLQKAGINLVTIQGDSMSRGANDAFMVLLGRQAAKALRTRKHGITGVLAIRNFRIMWAQAGLEGVAKTGPKYIEPELGAWENHQVPAGARRFEVYMPSSAVHGLRQGGNTLQRSRQFADEAERYLEQRYPGRHHKMDFWNATNARPELAADGMHYTTFVHYQMWLLILNAIC
eukprot:TRINITY_DN4249_c0_g1_i1.p1 TRINITY_DN4249_c0_g1~~TRINITY_DN4249_c0_g1_i1.p1  ORF type:complete len:692 (+),score=130.59 TRINITY_DN4249_c0_g1_i1:75-2150(+)